MSKYEAYTPHHELRLSPGIRAKYFGRDVLKLCAEFTPPLSIPLYMAAMTLAMTPTAAKEESMRPDVPMSTDGIERQISPDMRLTYLPPLGVEKDYFEEADILHWSPEMIEDVGAYRVSVADAGFTRAYQLDGIEMMPVVSIYNGIQTEYIFAAEREDYAGIMIADLQDDGLQATLVEKAKQYVNKKFPQAEVMVQSGDLSGTTIVETVWAGDGDVTVDVD